MLVTVYNLRVGELFVPNNSQGQYSMKERLDLYSMPLLLYTWIKQWPITTNYKRQHMVGANLGLTIQGVSQTKVTLLNIVL